MRPIAINVQFRLRALMEAFSLSDKYLNARASRDDVDKLCPLALSVPLAPLSARDRIFATTAWAYFATYCDHTTGLAPKTATEPTMTPWEMGSVIIANICAGRIGLISHPAVSQRLDLILTCLPLAGNRLPNAHYAPDNLEMLTGSGTISQTGVGWSPARIMRLITGLIILAHHFPEFAPEVSLILKKWHLGDMLRDGRFQAGRLTNNGTFQKSDQGVLGYEQYAARAACLIALPAQLAMNFKTFLRGQWFNGLLLPGDKRSISGRAPVITSEPFCLEALDFGWREDLLNVATSLFLAQKGRFEQTGHLTALSEGALDHPPGFAFHGVLAGHQPFSSFSATGEDLSFLRCLSTKAAFCWRSLIPTPYSQKLVDGIEDLQTDKGWLAGRYEGSGTPNTALSVNTNAVILEALHYKAFGPLFPAT